MLHRLFFVLIALFAITGLATQVAQASEGVARFVQYFDHSNRVTVTVVNEGDGTGSFEYVYACREDLGGDCPDDNWHTVTLAPRESRSFDISPKCYGYQLDFQNVNNGTGWVVYPKKCSTPTPEITHTPITPTVTTTPSPEPEETEDPEVTEEPEPTITKTPKPQSEEEPEDYRPTVECPVSNPGLLSAGYYNILGHVMQIWEHDGAVQGKIGPFRHGDLVPEDTTFSFELLEAPSVTVSGNWTFVDGSIIYNCWLQAVSVTPPPPPVQRLCAPALDGFVSCEQNISWFVGAYVFGNPDPFIDLFDVRVEQVEYGIVVVNSEVVAQIEFWQNLLFEDTVSGRWFYTDINLDDKVELHIKLKGMPVMVLPVEVQDAEIGFGNSPSPAMIASNGELNVFPGQLPEDIKEITQFQGEADELKALWDEAHVRTAQFGESTVIPADLKARMSVFNTIARIQTVQEVGTGVFWEVSEGTTWSGLLFSHGITNVYNETGHVAACGLNEISLKAGLPVEIPQCVLNALPQN